MRAESIRRSRGRTVARGVRSAAVRNSRVEGPRRDRRRASRSRPRARAAAAQSSATPDVEHTDLDRSPPSYPLDSTLRLNQIQVLGSHNSYHAPAVPAGARGARKRQRRDRGGPRLRPPPARRSSSRSASARSSSTCGPIPTGGKYAQPSLPTDARTPAARSGGHGQARLQGASTKPNIDTHSTCLTFVLCLRRGEDVVGRASRVTCRS